MQSWGINAVRIPLNEDCWLGINPVKRFSDHVKRLHGHAAQVAGAKLRKKYRADVEGYVQNLRDAGMIVILDLHWSAPGKVLADGQLGGPDTSHSVDFWRSMAETFGGEDGVIFDLFNEPKGISWKCLRDGGCPLSLKNVKTGATKKKGTVVGMQTLVDTVREAGADNPLMVSGLDYSDDLSKLARVRAKRPAQHTPRAADHRLLPQLRRGQPEGLLLPRGVLGRLRRAGRSPGAGGHRGVRPGHRREPAALRLRLQHVLHGLGRRARRVLPGVVVVRGVKFDGPGKCLALIKDYNTGKPTDYGQLIRDHYLARAKSAGP